MRFDYFYGEEANLFSFVRVPKQLIVGKEFAHLSAESKLLYGLILDRMNLSMKNGWHDENNRVYIIYKLEEIAVEMDVSTKTAGRYLTELKDIGLVENKKRGLGLADILYVKTFIAKETETVTSREDNFVLSENEKEGNEEEVPEFNDTQMVISQKKRDKNPGSEQMIISRGDRFVPSREDKFVRSRVDKNDTSRAEEIDVSERTNSSAQNKNNINNTKTNNNKSNLIESRTDEMGYGEIVRENIALDILIDRNPHDREFLEGIYELVLETLLSKNESILIASERYTASLVKSKLLKLNSTHIEYVMDSFKQNNTKIKNIKKYLLAALFNAPSTISGYYQAEVNHDMAKHAI